MYHPLPPGLFRSVVGIQSIDQYRSDPGLESLRRVG